MSTAKKAKGGLLASLLGLAGGLVLLPFLPFVSALLWQAGRVVTGGALLLAAAGYLVFFLVAIGWGALLLLLAILWCVIGSLVTWRRRRNAST